MWKWSSIWKYLGEATCLSDVSAPFLQATYLGVHHNHFIMVWKYLKPFLIVQALL